MKITKIINILNTAVVICFLLTSCQYKGFEKQKYLSAKVKVIYNWERAPLANPSSMNIWFLPKKEGNFKYRTINYQFAGQDGGYVKLPLGVYDVVTINNDSEVFQYRKENIKEEFELYTRESYLLEPLGIYSYVPELNPYGLPVYLEPDRLWYTKLCEVEVEKSVNGKEQEIELFPENLLCNYTVEINDVGFLDMVSKVSGSLSGLSGTYFLGLGDLAKQPAMIPFNCHSNKVSQITALFKTLGTCPDVETNNVLSIYMVLNDGRKLYQAIDVSDQVNNAPDRWNVHIVIDGMLLPDPSDPSDPEEGGDGGGFDPDIGDWEDIEVPIQM